MAEEVEGALARGDIVVYELTPHARERCGVESGKFVSRIVGLPGERVVVRGAVIDGEVLDEPHVRHGAGLVGSRAEATLTDDEYFVMGDNRAASCDSSVWGPLPRSHGVGRVIVVERGDERIELE